jgi:hypothetical protein
MKVLYKYLVLGMMWFSAIGLSTAQNIIKGSVTSTNGEPLPGVNVFIDQSIEGTVTGTDGAFKFATKLKGEQTLVFSLIGFETKRVAINCDKEVNLTIALRECATELNTVSIVAGNYEASDKKRMAVLTPLDVYTTSGALGDVTGAFRTLPGNQAAPEDGRLLVRGGEAYETKTYMDGLLIAQPYNSKVPDLPTRGRFAPSLFSGTSFNTGGYSAEYGQALSSVMLLTSTGLEYEPKTGVSVMSLGGEINQTWAGKNKSLAAGLNYFNMAPYFNLTDNKLAWERPTESASTHLIYRQQTKNGLLKAFVSGSASDLAYSTPSQDSVPSTRIDNRAKNIYTNITYTECITQKISYSAGISTSTETTRTQKDTMSIATDENTIDARVKLVVDIHPKVKLMAGLGNIASFYGQDYRANATSSPWHGSVRWNIVSQFVETEYHPIPKLAFKAGLRGEYCNLLRQNNLSPRLSMAVKTSENSQLSLALGQFEQMAENDYLKFNDRLDQQKATHLIASYQIGDVNSRLFRAEGYWKDYDQLVRYYAQQPYLPQSYNNSGYGYAKGIDLFFRDKKSVKNGDFWLSYSYIDTKRLYNDLPQQATPSFIAAHTVNSVSKYFIKQLNSQVSATYTFASGKPYHDPKLAGFMNARTPYYGNLSLSWSYLTNIADNFTVFYVSMSNVLGRKNIYGYNNETTTSGGEQLVPVTPDQTRFLFIGVFVNLL